MKKVTKLLLFITTLTCGFLPCQQDVKAETVEEVELIWNTDAYDTYYGDDGAGGNCYQYHNVQSSGLLDLSTLKSVYVSWTGGYSEGYYVQSQGGSYRIRDYAGNVVFSSTSNASWVPIRYTTTIEPSTQGYIEFTGLQVRMARFCPSPLQPPTLTSLKVRKTPDVPQFIGNLAALPSNNYEFNDQLYLTAGTSNTTGCSWYLMRPTFLPISAHF